MVDNDDDYMADLSQFLPSETSLPAPQGRRFKTISSDNQSKVPSKEKKKVKRQMQKTTEEEHLREGLNSAIQPSNIGFKMLKQMGYTPGVALGKHGQGIVEPVNIDLKRSRTGLGRDSAVKEEKLIKAKWAELQSVRNRQRETELRTDFQERRRESWHLRKVVSDYRKACATYIQLEESSSNPASPKHQGKDNSSAPEESDRIKDGDNTTAETEDGGEEEEEITPEMLLEILEKLRTQYNYCLYCGCKYDSAEALSISCPGLDEDH